jgi:thiamine-phosphate pyrophosphorylase
MEDYARFVLDDAGVSEQAKQIRHDLVAAVGEAGLVNVVRSRDIADDVGRDVQTPREYARATTADVVIAAGKRLSEALRVIEEYGKTVSETFGRAVEQLRYRGYDLEQRLRGCLEARERFDRVRLYVLLTASLCRGDWFQTARAAIAGGADCLQLREKSVSDAELVDRARRLSDLCHEHGVMVIINDRADIALASNADGVHLGQDDLPVRTARAVLGPAPLVGISTHTVEQARAAVTASPDYVAVGPMFASSTKPQEQIPGPSLLRQVRGLTALPIVAIGGITPENVSNVLAAGGRCVCVCAAVIGREDVTGAARRLKEALVQAGDADEGGGAV